MTQGTQEREIHSNDGAELNCTNEMLMVAQLANTDGESGVGPARQATNVSSAQDHGSEQKSVPTMAPHAIDVEGEIQILKDKVYEIEGEIEKLQWDVKSTITCQVLHPHTLGTSICAINLTVGDTGVQEIRTNWRGVLCERSRMRPLFLQLLCIHDENLCFM